MEEEEKKKSGPKHDRNPKTFFVKPSPSSYCFVVRCARTSYVCMMQEGKTCTQTKENGTRESEKGKGRNQSTRRKEIKGIVCSMCGM